MEKKIDSKLIYDGKIIKVYKDDILLNDNVKAIREVVKHQKGVCIALKDNDKYLLVKQFRYPFNKELIEFCAGKVEDNEDPDVTVVRECEEELGCTVKNMRKLGVIIPSCGYCDEEIHIYYGEKDKNTKQRFDEDEYLEVLKYTSNEIEEMIHSGIIEDAKTICAMHYLKRI